MAAPRPGDLVTFATRRRINGVQNSDRGEVSAVCPGQLHPCDVRLEWGRVVSFERD